MKRVAELPSVKNKGVQLKCYGMTRRAFERAAECAQKGFPPHSVSFTISAEDLPCRRNVSRTREEYLKEIPEFVKIAKANKFEIDMALFWSSGCSQRGQPRFLLSSMLKPYH